MMSILLVDVLFDLSIYGIQCYLIIFNYGVELVIKLVCMNISMAQPQLPRLHEVAAPSSPSYSPGILMLC